MSPDPLTFQLPPDWRCECGHENFETDGRVAITCAGCGDEDPARAREEARLHDAWRAEIGPIRLTPEWIEEEQRTWDYRMQGAG